MNLEKAIEILKYSEADILENCGFQVVSAIDTIVKDLDKRYQKGYQDGFKQAKFDCEMDKLDGR